jgi:nitroimidazol reductase NimA-like FMN-containing flavoprotein (pyridoxamine 5'-phosphate oxidase superfamily)
MPALTPSDIAAFLAEPGHLARVATVGPDGVPLVVPVWFVAEEGKVFITPRERSTWWHHLQKNPYVCIAIDEEARPWRKLVLRGSIEIVHGIGHDEEWRDRYRRIACRYVPEPEADAYLHNTRNEPRALLALPLEGATTWRMPVAGENPRQVWAERYYHDRAV